MGRVKRSFQRVGCVGTIVIVPDAHVGGVAKAWPSQAARNAFHVLGQIVAEYAAAKRASVRVLLSASPFRRPPPLQRQCGRAAATVARGTSGDVIGSSLACPLLRHHHLEEPVVVDYLFLAMKAAGSSTR